MCINGPISSYRYSTFLVYPTILQWVFHHYWPDSIVKVDFQFFPSADVTMCPVVISSDTMRSPGSLLCKFCFYTITLAAINLP